MKNIETNIQNKIIVALSGIGCIVFRRQVGKFYTLDARLIQIGIPGESDIQGHTPRGFVFYIEIKTLSGQLREDQKKFRDAMLKSGAIWGLARTPAEAIKIIEEGEKRKCQDLKTYLDKLLIES